MTSIDRERVNEVAAPQAKAAWQQFAETLEPLRPELYRYCRYLTRNAWDAEDLVQDTLARALVTLACVFQSIEQPRAWLFRVASNLWIDRQRRRREEPSADVAPAAPGSERLSLEARDAGATLIGRLSPQERAAVLLKDVFEFSIDETAGILATTPGAIKAALHRGRGKLSRSEPAAAPSVPAAVVDAFCDAFNARDLDRLVALLLDTATAEVVGIAVEYGPAKMRQPDTGSLYHSLHSPISHAVAARWRDGDRGAAARVERREYHDEAILVSWYDDDRGPVVRDVIRIGVGEEAPGSPAAPSGSSERIASVRFYFFCPDVIADVCGELGLPWRSNGYRYW
jgi:RNA polymerase sigma-70 factor (ECF subfamily)